MNALKFIAFTLDSAYYYFGFVLTGQRPRSDPVLEKLHRGRGVESLGSGSCCSTPPGSSCYSSQRSSPSNTNLPESPLHPSITRSLSHLLLEEEEEEEPETNVDTGVAVTPRSDSAVTTITRSSSLDLLDTLRSERPAAVGASAVDSLTKELTERLPLKHKHPLGLSKTWGSSSCQEAARQSCTSRTKAAGQSPSKGPVVENRTTADQLSANSEEPLDEFFI